MNVLAAMLSFTVSLFAVLDVMRRLLQPKNIMVSAHARTKEYDKSKYISILNVIQVSSTLGLVSCSPVIQALQSTAHSSCSNPALQYQQSVATTPRLSDVRS